MKSSWPCPKVYTRFNRTALLWDNLEGDVKSSLIAFLFSLTLAAAVDSFMFFPLTGRTAIKEVPNHLFNNPSLPPGILADYPGYQLFLIRATDPQKAAFVLLDYKKLLQSPKYLPNMGGYFGVDSAHRPNYVFAKGPFLAGVVGLPQDQADPIARQFAGRIPLK
jgi:hypothetical protein